MTSTARTSQDGYCYHAINSQNKAELTAVRRSVNSSTPFGSDHWQKATALSLGVESTLRPRSRPMKNP